MLLMATSHYILPEDIKNHNARPFDHIQFSSIKNYRSVPFFPAVALEVTLQCRLCLHLFIRNLFNADDRSRPPTRHRKVDYRPVLKVDLYKILCNYCRLHCAVCIYRLLGYPVLDGCHLSYSAFN